MWPSRHHGCRWAEGVSRGQRMLLLENATLRVSLLPDKGSDIAGFMHKPSDTDALWRSPWPPPFEEGGALSGGDPDLVFLDSYHGGWQELFPICGQPAVVQGRRLPAHGEVFRLPWTFEVEVDRPDEVRLRLETRTVTGPCLLQKWLTIRDDQPALFLRERLVLEGEEPLSFMWGHHPAFGAPFLKPGCRIDSDARTVLTSGLHRDPLARLAPDQRSSWPHAKGRDGGTVDLSVLPPAELLVHDWAYLSDFEDGWFALTDPAAAVGFALRWETSVMPYLLFWQNLRGALGAPYAGKAYTVGLEPHSTFPADHASGSPLLRLVPGEHMDFEMVAVAYQGLDAVRSVSREGVVA